MKCRIVSILIALWANSLASSQSLAGNPDLEATIRELEIAEVEAVLQRDVSALEALWSDDFMVNNPAHTVVRGKAAVLSLVDRGLIHYSSFEREIESIKLLGDIAIVMGLEIVAPTGSAPMAGQVIQRRYTNIWRLEDGNWKSTARHANVICRR